MARLIDPEILAGFLAEVRGYLPRIASALTLARMAQESGANDPKTLAEPYRLMHSIKGASSMIGLQELGHMAFYAEQALDELQLGERTLDAPLAQLLAGQLDRIDACLDGIGRDGRGGQRDPGATDSSEMLAATVAAFRRWRGLSPEGDTAELAPLLDPSAEPEGERVSSSPSPVRSGIAPDLLETFLEEAEEHLQTISTSLRTLRIDREDRAALLTVRRSVHTLKGAASLVGFGELARVAHRMEDLLDELADQGASPSDEDLALLFGTTDALEDLATGGSPAPVELADLSARYDRRVPDRGATPEPLRLASPPASWGVSAAVESSTQGLPSLASFLSGMDDGSEGRPTPRETRDAGPDLEALDFALTPAALEAAVGRATGATLRVPLERLDDVVRLASELVVHRSVFERHVADLARRVDEMSASHERLRRLAGRLEADYEVRALAGSAVGAVSATESGGAAGTSRWNDGFGSMPAGFDALELDRYTEFHLLSRELTETASDLSAVGVELAGSLVDFDGDLTRLGRLSSDVQNRLMRLRLVPLAQLSSRLHRAVRVTAEQEGKEVDLEIVGEGVELDKTVLEELADPLLHLLRNAVAHGIEPAALRRATAKPARGRIRVQAVYEGTEVTVRVSDDGAGMDPQALRSAAVAAGRLNEADAAALTETQAIELSFLPGLSTAGELSEISGRGVGLDVVRAGAHRAKGTVSVRSTPGRGTTFLIRLPMTLAVARVLMVRSNGESFAVPLAAVAQILRVERATIERLGREPVIALDGRVYPFLHLGTRLGLAHPADESAPQVPVLILRFDDRKAALAVDQLGQAREVVVKPLGPLLRRVPGISGATLTGDGDVVLIVNPGELVGDEVRGAGTFSAGATASGTIGGAGPRPLEIMVVDDSLSVRRVLGNLIQGVGWKAIPARDGLEALELLQRGERLPDVVLLDIEMPRMDGYELTATLRGLPEFATLPIVILTSRAGEKHRQRAFELGATEYLVKPYEEATLLSLIRRLAREAGAS